MDKADIPFLSAAQLSQLIKQKDVSPVEATQAYLDRIDSLDFKFNSYLTVARKHSMEAANEAERAIAQGNYFTQTITPRYTIDRDGAGGPETAGGPGS